MNFKRNENKELSSITTRYIPLDKRSFADILNFSHGKYLLYKFIPLAAYILTLIG
jgi:hypothetical protein